MISAAAVLLLKKSIHFESLHPSRADHPALRSPHFQPSTTQTLSDRPSSTEGCSAPGHSHLARCTLPKSGTSLLVGRARCCRPCQPQTCPAWAAPRPDHPLPYSISQDHRLPNTACLQALVFFLADKMILLPNLLSDLGSLPTKEEIQTQNTFNCYEKLPEVTE